MSAKHGLPVTNRGYLGGGLSVRLTAFVKVILAHPLAREENTVQ